MKKMENTTAWNTTLHLELHETLAGTTTELVDLVFEYLQSVEFFICFLANVLTITAVLKFDYLHKKSTNILILSLSIADGLLGKYLKF